MVGLYINVNIFTAVYSSTLLLTLLLVHLLGGPPGLSFRGYLVNCRCFLELSWLFGWRDALVYGVLRVYLVVAVSATRELEHLVFI